MIINNIPNKESKVTINTNLLTNWYFANPVNRRGGFCFVPAGTTNYTDVELTMVSGTLMSPLPVTIVNDTYSYFTIGNYTEYVSTDDVQYGYYQAGATIDRWYLQGEHSISLTDAGLKVTCSGGVSQNYILKQFHNLELGKTYTLSALIVENTTIEGVSARYAGLASVPLVGTGVVSCTFTYTEDILTDGVGIQFDNRSTDNGNYFIVSAIKLECGDTQTLAYQDPDGSWKLYEIPSYEEEYAKCVTIEPKVVNDNLLMNWYFGNPVNRKNGYYVPIGTKYYTDSALTTAGSAVTTSTVIAATVVNSTYSYYTVSGTDYYVSTADVKKGYVSAGSTIDGWWNIDNAAGVSLVEDGLKFEVLKTSTTSNLYRRLSQRILNHKEFLGKQMTVSALIRDYHVSDMSHMFGIHLVAQNSIDYYVANATTNLNYSGLYTSTFTVPEYLYDGINSYSGVNLQIAWSDSPNATTVGDYVIIEAVKLELGDTQTLAHQDKDGNWVLNEIPDYQEMYEQCAIFPYEYNGNHLKNDNEGFVPASGNVTMTGKLVAHSDTTYNAYRIRNVKLTSSNVTAGTTALENGSILLKYV